MKILLENWRKHLKEGQDPEYDVGAQPGGENSMYVLSRRNNDGQIVDIVGVYSSEDLAKEGRKSDIEYWRGQPDRMDQLPSPEDYDKYYDIEEFKLDGAAEPAAPPEEDEA